MIASSQLDSDSLLLLLRGVVVLTDVYHHPHQMELWCLLEHLSTVMRNIMFVCYRSSRNFVFQFYFTIIFLIFSLLHT